ncbi:polysaccharide biosynthesis protein [Echinicola pacifica]|uniref:Polysaccharide biosynthesis protein n=1 Tax=Echinicola pacifica TaxID=346377 RepID=A0A918UWA5_9BACT|nr:oligosaccharide flippase family protein [Echinicola pacifica]GGZ37873.1 polysaccharide biosynthesis protein [Echinicola pacifica]
MLSKFHFKNEFVKNVVTLMTGTGIAQAIPIALSPILSRIYSPDQFGLFALYTGISAILLVLATGRYELAIMLPAKNEEASDIVKLSICISLLISAITFFVVLFFGVQISELLGNSEIKEWLYFLPLSIFITGTYQALNYWYNRNKEFKRLALNRVVQSSSSGGSQLLFGLSNMGGMGLLYGSLIGQIITVYILFKKLFNTKGDYFSKVKLKSLKRVAIRYSKFPKFDIPTNLLSVGSTHAPNILFSSFFLATYSGHYYLTQRVLQAPITLISTSVLDVFKEEASRSYRKTGHARDVYLKTLKWLFFASIIPSVVMFFYIEDVFILVFGKDWAIAGAYAKILLPALAIKFIANPLSFMIYVAEKQSWNLIIMIFLALGMVLSFSFAESHIEVVENISIVYIVYYMIHLLFGAFLAGCFRKDI